MKDITDGDYNHAKKINVRSNTVLLASVFENFQNKSFEIRKLGPLLTAPGLAS